MELWRKNLYLLWGTQFLAMLGMNLVVPFLPFFIRELGVTDPDTLARDSGIVFAGPFVLSLIFTPVWGMLGDRYGRKPMVVRALFGLALSQALIGFSQSVWHLFAFRILQGAISGFIPAALALVSTNTPKARTGYAIGVLQSSTAAGMVLGPFVGGVLADLVGYRAIFFITATLCTAAAFIVMAQVREPERAGPAASTFTVLDNYRLMLTDRRLRIVALLFVVGQMSVLMIEPLFVLFVEGFTAESRYISTLAGGIVSISGVFMIISAPWWGKRNDRTGYRTNLAIALGVTGLCYAGHKVVTDLVQLGALRAFLGLARGGVLPALYALTSFYSPPDRRGGMMAIASSLTVLGNLLGPILGGAVAGAWGLTAVFFVNSALLIGAGILVWRMFEEPVPIVPSGIPGRGIPDEPYERPPNEQT
jgi:MFS transporter, DHA1 family, multidrug resistance protein